MHDIRWVTAFLDFAPGDFDTGIAFWQAATGMELSTRRGPTGEFATLLPAVGDPHLRVQRVADGPGGVHLDFHAAEVSATVTHAEACGARIVAEHAVTVMASPAGLVFCVVDHHGESAVPSPTTSPSGATTRVAQVSIDVPADLFDAECAFWADFTEWDLAPTIVDEFVALRSPDGMPMRLLLQRLGADDPSPSARGHLDIAAGDNRDLAVSDHEALGATLVRRTEWWTTLLDPTGHEYCITRRDPEGSLKS